MQNRYYLMRHGESLANLADKIIGSPANGLEGFGLSDCGQQQANLSAKASGLPETTLIVSSDFLRTRQTAETVSLALGAKIVRFHEGLRERTFGELEGLSGQQYQQVWYEDERDSEHTHLGVESALAVATRLRAVIDELETEMQGQDILLVSHGDPLRFLQLQVAGRSLTQHQQVRHFVPAEIRALHDLPGP